MKQDGPIGGYTGAIWTGVTTLTLAKAMEQAIKENLCGLYNLVNNESINKFDLLQLFNKYFRNGEVDIQPNDKLQLDKSLRCTRTDFSFVVPSCLYKIAFIFTFLEIKKILVKLPYFTSISIKFFPKILNKYILSILKLII